jgi:hypothetical protein
MNTTEAMELLRQILRVLDKIYHALITIDEAERGG